MTGETVTRGETETTDGIGTTDATTRFRSVWGGLAWGAGAWEVLAIGQEATDALQRPFSEACGRYTSRASR